MLDADQRRVVEHSGGPLLVLAGPGTGKTSTLVEAVVHRVQHRRLAPEQVLVLTFSRRAAQQLREQITGRLGGTSRGPRAMTFHSYAYALLRRELGGPPLRLLTGSEQDVEVHRLLAGEIADGAARWPAELHPALPLKGFRAELRDLMQRAQERGLGGAELRALGDKRGRADWVAAGGFLAAYEARFDLDPSTQVIDQSCLVGAAAALLENDALLREQERAARVVVLVDEYQDTDPAQVRLLQALCHPGRELIAVGDPDQSIYGFRGADVRGILRFTDAFAQPSGESVPVVPLTTCWRSGAALLAATRSVASRLPRGPIDPAFRDLTPDPDVVPGPGSVQIRLAPTLSAETALVAEVLRRAHLVDGLAWSEMAVLLRATPRSLAVLRRGLLTAGVPVAVPADEVPLAEEPVVRALLAVLTIALRPGALDETAALELLTGPLVRADALAVRRLRRALRELEEPGAARPSGQVLVAAVSDPGVELLLPQRLAAPLHRVRDLLAAARVDGTAEDVLWSVWQTCGLAGTLERESLRGGPRGAVADRSLDAAIALFAAAARFVDRLPHLGVLDFLDDVAAQEVPADPLSQRTPDGDAVRLMTAHASKGMQWRLVVVAGVQEGVWPDLRLRGSLLGTPTLLDVAAGEDSAHADHRAGLLAEERRLFYVACTRARERLVVTAVSGGEGSEDRPSRFLGELGLELPAPSASTVRPLTGAGLVAELRQVAATTEDPVLREAACRRLARMVRGDGAPRVPAADPDSWWGVAELSDTAPLVLAGETVRVSPSKVQAFDTCSLRWFLESGVGISSSTGPAQVLGSLVHALCELASGADALGEAELHARLDQVLPQLDLGAPWEIGKHRQKALDQLAKFLRWAQANPRELVATELDVAVRLGDDAELRGRVDRLERDDHGRAVVVDLKTGTKAKRHELVRHPQLGVYQLAVRLGAFVEHGLTEPGGASLLQLKENKDADEQSQVALAADAEPDWAAELVQRVVAGMSAGDFPATVNEHCERTCQVRSSCPAWPEGTGVVRRDLHPD